MGDGLTVAGSTRCLYATYPSCAARRAPALRYHAAPATPPPCLHAQRRADVRRTAGGRKAAWAAERGMPVSGRCRDAKGVTLPATVDIGAHPASLPQQRYRLHGLRFHCLACCCCSYDANRFSPHPCRLPAWPSASTAFYLHLLLYLGITCTLWLHMSGCYHR